MSTTVTPVAPEQDTIEQDADRARAALAVAYPRADMEAGIADLIADLMHLADAEEVDGGGYRVAKVATGNYSEQADQANLDALAAAVRQAVPTAASMRLETSDQDSYGFFLLSLAAADGSSLVIPDDLVDEASELLCNITWDGVVGEDGHGYATLALTPQG